MIKISDLVFDFLSATGIDTVFTVSGGGCMHLVDSLGKNNKIQYVCNHHEQACAIAAESYSKACNGRIPGCILVTTGPGGTNALTGVLCAYQDSVPMIVISGQVPTNQTSIKTGCRQIGQQEFNIVDTVKYMTKYSVMIKNKNDILYELQKAYYISMNGRPGPVWIDIPLDIQSCTVDYDSLEQYKIPVNNSIIKNLYNRYKLNQLKKLLKIAKKPVVVVGGGIRMSDTKKKLDIFLEQHKIPALTGPHSAVDMINNDYEFYAGRFGLLGQKTSNNIIQESDLVISLGSRLNPKMIGYNSMRFAPNATKFIIDVDKKELDKLKFSNKKTWNIDLKSFFDMALDKLEVADIKDWQNKVKKLREKEQLVLDKHKNLKKYASTYVFAELLSKCLEDDSVVVTSDGTAHVVPLKTMVLKKQQILFSNEATAPMGYGLPAAIGAYFATKKHIVCIEGDGSIMMNLQELQTVKHHNIPVTIVIINNEGYLSIKLTQNNFFNGHLVASSEDSGVSIPCFKKIAECFGFDYYAISDNSMMDKSLHTALSKNTMSIVEIFTDPNELHEPKVKAKGFDKNGNIIPGDLTDI